MNHHRGFTAIEFLIAMTLATLLVVLAVPAWRAMLVELRLRAAAGALHGALLLARREAILRGGLVVACPGGASGCSDGDWETGWVVFVDADGDREPGVDESILRINPGIEHLRITSAAARRRLAFYANGTAPGSNATLQLCAPGNAAPGRQIRVSNSGRIRQVRNAEGSPDSCAQGT